MRCEFLVATVGRVKLYIDVHVQHTMCARGVEGGSNGADAEQPSTGRARWYIILDGIT